jgi:hypothetical protein
MTAPQTSLPPSRQHVHDLARAFDARVIESDQLRPDEALGITAFRIVICRPVADETSYAVALHELGHLAAPLGVIRHVMAGDRGNLHRIEEAAAWEWARHYALEWTPTMESVATWAESTYAAKPAAAPPPVPVAPQKKINWNEWK